MKVKGKSDTTRVFEFLLTGCRSACKDSWRLLRVPDLRSRIADIERQGFTVQRERVKGKMYKEFFFKPIPKK